MKKMLGKLMKGSQDEKPKTGLPDTKKPSTKKLATLIKKEVKAPNSKDLCSVATEALKHFTR